MISLSGAQRLKNKTLFLGAWGFKKIWCDSNSPKEENFDLISMNSLKV